MAKANLESQSRLQAFKKQYLYSAAVAEAFGLPGFIHANAEAPPTGLDDLGIAAMVFGTF
jgi:hypothetical protein